MCSNTKFKTAICKKYGFYIKNIVVFLYLGILISCKNGIQTWETRTIINIQDIFVEWIHGCVCTHTHKGFVSCIHKILKEYMLK